MNLILHQAFQLKHTLKPTVCSSKKLRPPPALSTPNGPNGHPSAEIIRQYWSAVQDTGYGAQGSHLSWEFGVGFEACSAFEFCRTMSLVARDDCPAVGPLAVGSWRPVTRQWWDCHYPRPYAYLGALPMVSPSQMLAVKSAPWFFMVLIKKVLESWKTFCKLSIYLVATCGHYIHWIGWIHFRHDTHLRPGLTRRTELPRVGLPGNFSSMGSAMSWIWDRHPKAFWLIDLWV